MNKTIIEILKSPNGKNFIDWYIAHNFTTPVKIFVDLPFECQFGVLLTFLEDKYGFSVIADNTGFICYFTSTRERPILLKNRFQTRNFYHIHSEEGMLASCSIHYGKAIVYLFMNLDIPF